MSRAFGQAFAWQLSTEGVFSNDPDDTGRETKYGISKKAYPDLDIPSLTKEQAKEIYLRDYWHKCRCDEFQQQIALALFDAATNQGVYTAVMLLQQALGVEQDGIVGPKTVNAARLVVPGELLLDFLSHRAVRYSYGKEKYRRGWFRRLFRLQAAAWSMA